MFSLLVLVVSYLIAVTNGVAVESRPGTSGIVKNDSNGTFIPRSSTCPTAHSPVGNECTNPIYGSCAFYLDCAESQYCCGPNGYPVAYGDHYCNAFRKKINSFTPAGQKWVWDTMYCLQTKLATFLEAGVGTCTDLSKFAFNTHPECYIDTGVCKLEDLQDYTEILEVIGLENLLSEEGIAQGLTTGFGCIITWLGL